MDENEQNQILEWIKDFTHFNEIPQRTAYQNYAMDHNSSISMSTFSRFLARQGIHRKSKRFGQTTIKVYGYSGVTPCPTCNGLGSIKNI